MILEKQKTEFDTTCNGEVIDFKIENDAQIFQALSTTLYPYPIRAICREITANALDAHREVGKADIPVKIFIPGEYFCVQDFGPGLSPDRMRTVFCYLGRSTKRDSNDQQGAYGLGAKTPYAYASQFSIETVVDSIHYTYTAFKDENCLPKIMLVDQRPTKLPTGTTIKIPVSYSDRWSFRENLLRYTKFWTTQPEFVGMPQGERLIPTLESDRWAIYLKDVGSTNVLVDGVPYEDNDFGIPSRVVLKFKIGEVDLTLNRDELRYTAKTKTAIEAALAAYDKEVVEKMKGQLDKSESFPEAIKLIETLPKAHEHREWTWKTHKFSYPLAQPIRVYEKPRNKFNSYMTNTFNIYIQEKSFVMLDKEEVTSYDRQRIGYWMRSNNIKHVYLLEKDHVLPIDVTTKLSEIKLPKVPRGPRGPRQPKIYIKGRTYRSKRQDDWLINATNTVVYTTKPWEEIDHIYYFPKTIVQIAEKDVKYIEDEDHWIELDEYVQQKLYDRLTTEEIQKEVDSIGFIKKYEDFDFLGDLPKFKLLKTITESTIDDETKKLIRWIYDSKQLEANIPDLFKEYPLLEMLRYVRDEHYKDVIEYVNLIDRRKDECKPIAVAG